MPSPRLALLRTAGAGICLAIGLAGCVSNGDVTGSIGPAALPAQPAALRSYADEWGQRYETEPTNKEIALRYATALRALDRYPQAVAVLETVAIKYPYDKAVLAAYGKALADVGRLKEAAEVLPRAHSPDKPDWSVLSAQGSVADQMGDHAAAQGYYEAALKIAPESASTLSNLGLSYALDKRLTDAEPLLRRAVSSPGATPRVRQNLAFVLALEGKDGEAQQVASADLSPSDAAQSIAAIKAMVAETRYAPARRPTKARVIAMPATAG